MGWYSSTERFFGRVKRHGLIVYTVLIIGSAAYVMYAVSNMPQLPPPRKKKGKKEPAVEDVPEVSQEPSVSEELSGHKTNVVPEVAEEPVSDEPVAKVPETSAESVVSNTVNAWSKRELYLFLANEKIFLDIDQDLSEVRQAAIDVLMAKVEDPEVIV